MKERTDLLDVGVIVGRFQVPELHEAHRALIEFVCERHSKVLIFLGLAPAPSTRNNPLDFRSRQQMFAEAYPEVEVYYVKDQRNDERWSKALDAAIANVLPPGLSVALYGGRESFIDHYRGKHTCVELESDTYINSGTEARKQIAKGKSDPSIGFRRGQVYAAYNRFPTPWAAVDVAVFNGDEDKLLLGKRNHEDAWRLLGGFVEPPRPGDRAGQSLLIPTARREAMEEANVAITDPVIVGDFVQPDWRYANEADCIFTVLCKAHFLSGSPQAGDDIDQVRWWPTADLKPSDIVEEHHHLFEALGINLSTKGPK